MTDEEIYLKYRDELIRYATVLVGPSDAEDVLSSVLTRLYRSKRSLGGIEFPRPYLMKAVLNESLNQRRHRDDQPLAVIAVESTRSGPEVLEAVLSLPTRGGFNIVVTSQNPGHRDLAQDIALGVASQMFEAIQDDS